MRPKKLKWGGRYEPAPYMNAKLQKGGTISELGYMDHSPFKNNPFLDINSPNGSITMQNVSTPLLGVDNLGVIQTMLPNKEYGFPGKTITEMPLEKNGGLIKRADGSYSKHGLWDSIRENKGSGKKPSSEMLKQERKIKMQMGGLSRYDLETKAKLDEKLRQQKLANLPSISQYTPKEGDVERMNTNRNNYREEEAKPFNRAASSKVAANAMENIVEPMADVAMAMEGAGLAGKGLKQAGKYLTEKTVLKDAYKLNPYAFKPNSNNLYRQIGESGYKDAIENNIIRSTENFPKPYFAEGDAFYNYENFSPGKNKYMVEMPMLKNQELTAFPTRPGGKEWVSAEANIPLSDVKMYKNNWLQGYKEIPIERKPIFSQPEITREPINYYDKPGFKEQNPKITDWENYKGDVKLGKTSNDQSLNPYLQNNDSKFKSAIGNNGMFDMNNPNIYKTIIPAIGIGAAGVGATKMQTGGNVYSENNPFMQQGGMSKSNYDFLFDEEDEEDQKVPIIAPSTEDIQQEREQFEKEKLDWTNQQQYDEAMQAAMSVNEDEEENDKLYEGIFTPIDNKLPSFQSTSFPNLRTTPIPNFNSNGTFGMQNISPQAINMGNEFANALGYKPTFNSIYRDEKLNTSVGGKPNSQHLKATAIDVKPFDWNNIPKEKQQELKSKFTIIDEGNHIHSQLKKQMGGVLYSSGQTLNNLSYDDIIRLKKQGYKFSFQE